MFVCGSQSNNVRLDLIDLQLLFNADTELFNLYCSVVSRKQDQSAGSEIYHLRVLAMINISATKTPALNGSDFILLSFSMTERAINKYHIIQYCHDI
jgi:hypothetical protein